MNSTENPRSRLPHREPPKVWPCYGAPGYRGDPRFRTLTKEDIPPQPSRFFAKYQGPSQKDRCGLRMRILVPGEAVTIPLEGDRILPISLPPDLDKFGQDLRDFYAGFGVQSPVKDSTKVDPAFAIGTRAIEAFDPELGVDSVTVVAPTEKMRRKFNDGLEVPPLSFELYLLSVRSGYHLLRVDTVISSPPPDKSGKVKPVVTLDMNLL